MGIQSILIHFMMPSPSQHLKIATLESYWQNAHFWKLHFFLLQLKQGLNVASTLLLHYYITNLDFLWPQKTQNSVSPSFEMVARTFRFYFTCILPSLTLILPITNISCWETVTSLLSIQGSIHIIIRRHFLI